MKKIFKNFIITVAVFLTCSCDFLEPLPNGAYTDENFNEYPELLRGFVDKIYNDYIEMSFYTNEYIGLSAMSDEAMYSSESSARRLFAEGKGVMTSDPYSSFWTNNYAAINYANLFLKDRVGYNTQYMLDQTDDLQLRQSLQGSAFAMRAWMLFGLLKVYAGEGTDGQMYGVPIMLEPTEFESVDVSSIKRATIDECCSQILKDCDSAYVYLKDVNRDLPGDDPSNTVIGSARYTTMDRLAVDALRAETYLFWASPAWNPTLSQDSDEIRDRYTNAAKYAAKVMKFKLETEGALLNGFNPNNKVIWTDSNSPEIIWCGHTSAGTTAWETAFYPMGFGGSATIVPTQELVDCFPAANGYPITDSRSKYDPNKPYEGRDSRFYSTINYNGAKVLRNTDKNDVMYTFETAVGGKDAPGQVRTSATGYYTNKFVYTGWNPFDAVVQKAPRPLMHYRWTQMCLIFAEAASRVTSPTDASTFGYSAKQALQWLRSRPASNDMPGVGKEGDPYLDECAGEGGAKFYELVKNEWKVETCFEGKNYYNVRRWATSVDDINVELHKVVITNDGRHEYEVVSTLDFPSLWQPIPYLEVRRCPNLIQNKGYESWK